MADKKKYLDKEEILVGPTWIPSMDLVPEQLE